MKETRADTAEAIGFALLLHVLLVVVLFLGLWWTRTAAPSAAGAVSAELVDASELSAAMRRTLREPAQPAEPTPPPQQAQPKPQETIAVPDERNQEAVVEQPTPTPAIEKQLQEEKHRQEQVDLTEQQRQLEAQQKQQLKQLEQERLKQLADIRKQRAQAAREAQLAEAKLKQLSDYQARNAAEAATMADARATPGNNGTDDELAARYAAALTDAILRNWTRPDNIPDGLKCRINIRQIQGGQVVDVEVSPSCPYDEPGRRSVEAAVLKAQPLPFAGFESVFRRKLELDFVPHD